MKTSNSHRWKQPAHPVNMDWYASPQQRMNLVNTSPEKSEPKRDRGDLAMRKSPFWSGVDWRGRRPVPISICLQGNGIDLPSCHLCFPGLTLKFMNYIKEVNRNMVASGTRINSESRKRGQLKPTILSKSLSSYSWKMIFFLSCSGSGISSLALPNGLSLPTPLGFSQPCYV